MKELAYRALCATGVAAAARRRFAGDTLVLAYHNIVPVGENVAGDASLHLRQEEFARQLDVLGRTHEVVPLPALFTAARGRRPRAVITFDDACQGAVTAGVEELRRRGMTATIFVAPAFVGGRSFWWDAVYEEESAPLHADVRVRGLHELQGRDERVRVWAASAGLRVRNVPWHQTAATEAQLHGTAAADLTLGSHSWSHPNLPLLKDDELRAELTQPLQWLRGRFRHMIPWLAYPYGLRSPAVAAAARLVGYEGAVRVTGGWVRARHLDALDRYEIPRLNIPAGLSISGFELQTSGMLTR